MPEPGTLADGPAGREALLAAAGPIARVVNHYDGPKVPRAGAPMPTLHGSIEHFHAALGGLRRPLARSSWGRPSGRRSSRYTRVGTSSASDATSFDPSTAGALERIAATGLGPALPARLWGAPEPDGAPSSEARAGAALPSLRIFAKAARAEHLDGFVISGPALGGAAASRAAWLGALVAAIDPRGTAEAFEVEGSELRARVLVTGAGGEAFALVQAR